MRKKIGFNSGLVSASVSAPDGNDLTPKLLKLLWSYADEMRPHESADTLDLTAFMLYCSYVSRNADGLGLEDFDLNYSIDKAKYELGNKYVASDFVDYYASLCIQNPKLPDLRGVEFRTYDLSKAIGSWASILDASGLSLMEDSGGKTATTIQQVLAKMFASDTWGRYGGEYATPLSIVALATRLANVEGKTVLDFACGNGIYLASALSKGAASDCGRDVSAQVVMRAKIGCFFANPTTIHDIAVADALTAASVTAAAQCIFAAPPLAMHLHEFDIQEKDYFSDVMAAVVGNDSVRTPFMEDFFVAKAYASLTDDGIAVMHVSASFLFHQQKARQTLRSAMVEGGRLQTVIELPGGVIPGTSAKSALLVVGKQPTGDGVFIVDLDSKELTDKGYVSKGRGRCEITELGIDWLVKTVNQRDEIPLVSTVAERERILASGSNLCYSSYGDVFDYGAILDEVRLTEDIMDDIKAAQASIDSLSEQIADILNSIEKKG
ncbi:MAG: SAM-dependent DNA methyltransferase [Atopobiaceae bacterium]|nr:SAM-dependent DNA methyltransferase [Atopobiaceae bacterium]